MNTKRIFTFLTVFVILIASYFQVSIIKGNKDNQLIINSEQVDRGLTSIYIGGEVNVPGTYEVDTSNTILFVVYTYAGGFTTNANIDCIDINSTVEDTYYLIIPNYTNPNCQTASSDSDSFNELVNINTASKEQLQTINGIGQVTAANIIAYRTSNGFFKTKEEIMNVSGIGTATYDKIKDYITV